MLKHLNSFVKPKIADHPPLQPLQFKRLEGKEGQTGISNAAYNAAYNSDFSTI